MPEASDTRAILRENLKDAGCDSDIVHRCEALIQSGKNGELMQVLSRHRRVLLDTVHENEKRIDCLDYLIYQIKKQDKKTNQ